jgi:acetolactate synthase-1/2/3 large subunit
MTSVAERVVDTLRLYGVDTVFGIPGIHTLPFYRAFGNGGIRHIGARHEQAAGFMADGYARACARPGVCCVISGPGVTNIATAMGQAYADSVPLLVLSSVNALGQMGSGEGHLHEMPDQRGLTGHLTAFSHTLTRPEEIETVIARAFAVFDAARPRPVHIELPLDVLTQPCGDWPRRTGPRLRRPLADPALIAMAVAHLAQSRRPLLILGGGAADAAEPARQLAEALDAPVIMTVNGRGLLPPDHPLGVSFSPSLRAVRRLFEDCDLVLAAGTEMGPTDFDAYAIGKAMVPAPLVRLDIDPQQAVRNFPADLTLVGDAHSTLAAIVAGLDPVRPPADGRARAASARTAALAELDPVMRDDLAILAAVRATLPHALIVGDSTRMVYAAHLGAPANSPRTLALASTGFGTLGYGLPAAIGAALARPECPIVCLVGDGGLQFSLAELATAVEVQAPVIMLLLNNGGYGEIKAYMRAEAMTPLGVDLLTPDFLALARSFGWQAEPYAGATGFATQLREAAGRRSPCLIEIRVPVA